MAIYDYLPKYYQIEANNLKALQPGFVVAQMEVDPTATFVQVGKNVLGSASTAIGNMVANGHIVSIGVDGIKDPVAGDPLFIVYNEPLNTVFDGAKFYATDINAENLRCVQLIPGDEWMTDMVYDLSNGSPLQGRIVEVNAVSGMSHDDWFAVTELADGTSAKHYVFIK
jgi:hypothetical protein